MQEFDWKNNVDNREQKQKLAKRIAKRVKDGDIIGLGSGSTSYLAVEEIAKRVHEENLKIKAIPTSTIIEEICQKLKIETVSLDEAKPDWCFDGADEVDPHNWLIKGMGAALYREKMNIKASEENYILVDSSKFVEKLGQNHPVPVECKIDKIDEVKDALKNLGANNVTVKESNVGEGILITDNGNALLFAQFPKIEANYEEEINKIDGVVENGLFIGYDLIIIK